jgi:hypothetical protein
MLWCTRWRCARERGCSDQGAQHSASARMQRSSTAGVLSTLREGPHSSPTAKAAAAQSTRLCMRLSRWRVHNTNALLNPSTLPFPAQDLGARPCQMTCHAMQQAALSGTCPPVHGGLRQPGSQMQCYRQCHDGLSSIGHDPNHSHQDQLWHRARAPLHTDAQMREGAGGLPLPEDAAHQARRLPSSVSHAASLVTSHTQQVTGLAHEHSRTNLCRNADLHMSRPRAEEACHPVFALQQAASCDIPMEKDTLKLGHTCRTHGHYPEAL